MKYAWTVLAGLGLFCVGLGFLGRVHPAGDSWAVLRGGFCLIGLPWMALGWWRGWVGGRLAIPAGLALMAALGTTVVPRWPGAGEVPEAFVHYQKNVLYLTENTKPLARDIQQSGADLVTLQEVGEPLLSLRDQIAPELPHWHRCALDPRGGVVIASRYPLQAAECVQGTATAVVNTPLGPIRVVSIHLSWPWPWNQQVQGLDAARRLAELQGPPLLIGGDFNAVPWTYLMRETQRVTGTQRAGAVRDTLPLLGGLVDLAIDHVLLPVGWTGETSLRPLLGSDHLGVLVTVRDL